MEDQTPLKYHDLLPYLKGSRNTQSQPIQTSNNSGQQIYTVYESLKDQYVLKNLDVELGSLAQFIDLKSTDPSPQLPNLRLKQRFRKKNEAKEDEAQMLLKKPNQAQLQKNPFELLKSADDEKTRRGAAKQIVRTIFKRIYGDDIDKFQEKNSKEALQQIYIDGSDLNDPKINFIKKNMKFKRSERFEMFEKHLNQTKTSSQKSKFGDPVLKHPKRDSGMQGKKNRLIN